MKKTIIILILIFGLGVGVYFAYVSIFNKNIMQNNNLITLKLKTIEQNVKTVKDLDPENFNNVVRDDDGNIRVLSNIIDDEVKGTGYIFYDNGNINFIGVYSGGDLVGESIYYYENGQTMEYRVHSGNSGIDYFYKNDGEFIGSGVIEMFKDCTFYGCSPFLTIRDGIDVIYYNDNSIREIHQKKDGIDEFIRYYSTTGSEIGSIEYREYLPYNGVEYTFYSNGQIESEYHYNNGNLDGPGYRYYEDGNISSESYIKNGKWIKHNVYTPNGYLEDSQIYNENGDKIQWIFYYKNGQPSRIIYYEGEQTLKTEYFDENGNMTSISQKNDEGKREIKQL